MKKTETTHIKRKQKSKGGLAQGFLFLCLIAGGVLVYQEYERTLMRQRCPFFKDNICFSCDTPEAIAVGYKEQCALCANRTAYYMDEGALPAWQCLITPSEEQAPKIPPVGRSKTPCPKDKPLKDILGNCHGCDADIPMRLSCKKAAEICQQKRYTLPDGVMFKSLHCPEPERIQNAETCVACGGVVNGGKCQKEGENRFCAHAQECAENEVCVPFLNKELGAGVCALKPATNWICSATDGYDLASAEAYCAAFDAHIPTLEEIAQADENLAVLCPTLDMWTFFAPDGVVWLDSFTQEFLFTREGESSALSGHQFYALCHKN